MEIEIFFKEVGGNYDSVLKRLPSEDMIRKFILKFPNDTSYNSLEKAFSQNDAAAAFLAAHTLKGTAASLGLDLLANAASELTEQLRDAKILADKKYFDAVKNAYELTIEKIGLLS